jgi:hypothetical protein
MMGARPLIESAMGPYSKIEAEHISEQFRVEYDGSPWHAIVRPLIAVRGL